MDPLACEALSTTRPSRAERVLWWIPFIGWAFAATLQQERFRPLVREIEGQLRGRPPTGAAWEGPREDLARRLLPILAEEFGWPNDRFLPGDPFRIVFWAHEDGLDDELALLRIEATFAVSLPRPELERLWRQGTLGEFVDFVLSQPGEPGQGT